MSDEIGDLIARAQAGEIRALARLLSRLEEAAATAGSLAARESLATDHLAFRVGLTGPPGAGKSTLINRLIESLRAQGKRVAVMAVDPSSPFTKGAVLGDRIRYQRHFGDEGVFIRSLGTRGSSGGLSASAWLMVRAFDLAGFDVVLIETAGVGQTELEIMNVADWVAVALVPESGDSIQGMKAGILEIADLFVVNKSDRPGAESFRRELESALRLDPRAAAEPVEALPTTATTGEGIEAVVSRFMEVERGGAWRAERSSPTRLRAEARALLRREAERAIDARVASITSVATFESALKAFRIEK